MLTVPCFGSQSLVLKVKCTTPPAFRVNGEAVAQQQDMLQYSSFLPGGRVPRLYRGGACCGPAAWLSQLPGTLALEFNGLMAFANKAQWQVAAAACR